MVQEIIKKYLAGEVLSQDELLLLQKHLGQEDHAKDFFQLKDLNAYLTKELTAEELDVDALWHNLEQKITSATIQSQKHTFFIYFRYTALFVLGAILSLAYQVILNKNTNQTAIPTVAYTEIRTKKGEQVEVSLPDGSIVKLNASSLIRYANNFGHTNRRLTLEGEGFFDVQTNPMMPFDVQTGNLSIQALGTSFNIQAYPNETIEASLVEGILLVKMCMDHDSSLLACLHPNQMALIPRNNEASYVVKNTDTDFNTSWIKGKLMLDGIRFEDLAKTLERKYDVDFILANDLVKNLKFSGTLANFSLEQVLNAIKLTAPINYKIQEKEVIVTLRNK